jgi:hypothetical protein
MGQEEATRQSDNLRPPIREECVAVTVDSTARSYDLSAIAWPTIKPRTGQDGVSDYVYITLFNDGSNVIYHLFDEDTQSDLNDTTVDSAGAAPLTLNAAHGSPIVANGRVDWRINWTNKHRWIQVKCASGLSSTLRMHLSSQGTPPGAW